MACTPHSLWCLVGSLRQHSQVPLAVDRQLVVSLLHEDEVYRWLLPRLLTPLRLRLLVIQVVDLVEDLAQLQPIVENDVVLLGSTFGQLESKRQMLVPLLIVPVAVQDVLLHLQGRVEVFENPGQRERRWHLVALERNSAIVLPRIEVGQAVGEGNEVAADVLAVVGLGGLEDESVLVDLRKVVPESLILLICLLAVAGPVRFRVCSLADGEEALH